MCNSYYHKILVAHSGVAPEPRFNQVNVTNKLFQKAPINASEYSLPFSVTLEAIQRLKVPASSASFTLLF